jgi:hypothetical protein
MSERCHPQYIHNHATVLPMHQRNEMTNCECRGDATGCDDLQMLRRCHSYECTKDIPHVIRLRMRVEERNEVTEIVVNE